MAKFSRVGQKHTICLKNAKNILFSFKKVEKHTILAGQGGGGRVPPLALTCGRPRVEIHRKILRICIRSFVNSHPGN